MPEHIRQSGWRAVASLALLALTILSCRQASAPTRETPVQSSAQTAVADNLAVRTEIGFASRQKFLAHFQKHGHEFGVLNADEYLRQAQTLRDRPTGKDVLEVVRADGVITRFDRQSGAFLAFNQDLIIRTYFKPNDGVNYFWRQSRR